jgi:hypothetical protein
MELMQASFDDAFPDIPLLELLESETMRKQFGDAARQHCIRSFDGMDIAKKSVQFYSTHLS